MALQTTIKFQQFAAFPPPSRRRSRRILIHPKFLNSSTSCSSMASRSEESRSSSSSSSPMLVCSFAGRRVTFRSSSRLRASTNTTTTTTGKLNSYDNDDEDGGGPSLMSPEERHEWRTKIRQVLDASPDVEEEVDLSERTRKMQELLADYPLVVEEEDPEWPDDADGRGFNLDQFFNKITIKNVKKKKEEEELDDDDSDSDNDNELVWQDDDYIRPIKDITTAEWEDAVFKDISPLIVLVHNRYKRPKENEKFRDELEKAVQIIWNCRLPSPRCVAVDAVVEVDLVSALKVSIFPEMLFTKAGKILYREKAHRTADELSKIMAFFYYGASKPPCLNSIGNFQEAIPSVPINSQT